MPSPQTPLPERARGFENLQLFLAPLLLLWEKGLGDEGKRFVSQSALRLMLAAILPSMVGFDCTHSPWVMLRYVIYLQVPYLSGDRRQNIGRSRNEQP
jgi:hypothetical protein